MSMRESILGNARSKQATVRGTRREAGAERPAIAGASDGTSDTTIRYILEFDEKHDPAAATRAIQQQLGIEVSARPLAAAHGERGDDTNDALDRFMAVTVDNVSPEDLSPSPFEFGYALADATGAVTAEPELGTDFFTDEGTESAGRIESTGGCWVAQDSDPSGTRPKWAVESIRALSAWRLPPAHDGLAKGEGVRVFQPDTGVADHSELGDGMLDISDSYDFVEGKTGAADPLDYTGNPGHGTGTASVVAGRGASRRMSGSAPAAKLVPLRAIERVVVFDHGRVAAAVEFARRRKADVITMSLGGSWSSSLRAAIGKAIADGVIVLAAAGNCVRLVVWPARYEEVIAVAGCNCDDRPWIGSCHGDAVDVTAPGEFVPRANRAAENGGSATEVSGGQGTSFAVALTAGVAALWIAHHGREAIKRSLRPGETVQGRFVELLKRTSRVPQGWDTSEFGAGIVDAEKLLLHPLDPAPSVETTAHQAPVDQQRSLRTLLHEVSAADRLEVSGDTRSPSIDRQFAAELSHLALDKQRRHRSVGRRETISTATSVHPSVTLARALQASGEIGILEALR